MHDYIQNEKYPSDEQINEIFNISILEHQKEIDFIKKKNFF